MKEESIELLIKMYPANGELKLLKALGYYFQNWRSGFKKAPSANTYVLSPEGSELFDLNIVDGHAVLGTSKPVYDLIRKTPLFNFNILEDAPGIFLMFNLGVGEQASPSAIRIFKRKVQCRAISRYSHLYIYPLDDDGKMIGYNSVKDFNSANSIAVPICVLKEVDWERENRTSRV